VGARQQLANQGSDGELVGVGVFRLRSQEAALGIVVVGLPFL